MWGHKTVIFARPSGRTKALQNRSKTKSWKFVMKVWPLTGWGELFTLFDWGIGLFQTYSDMMSYVIKVYTTVLSIHTIVLSYYSPENKNDLFPISKFFQNFWNEIEFVTKVSEVSVYYDRQSMCNIFEKSFFFKIIK